MYPMYGWTDSHPHPRNQMFYGPHHTQSFEPVPPHIKVDPARPSMFEPWPYGGSYGYSYPTVCHGCSNHNYFPGHYYFRPPYPHFPPPSPHNYHGNYSPFFGGYPGYQIPPPHFSVEQPRYEYDKGFRKDQHCCGCPNHSCKRESDENVEIEERKMDIDKKSDGSLVPSHLRNFPFPFAMIPPSYLMDSERSKPAKSEGKEDNKINHEMECDKSSKSLNTGGPLHKKETKSQKDMQSQFPFPLFWLSYKPEEVEKDDLKRMNSGQEAVIAPYEENNDKVKIPSSATGPEMIGDGATQKSTLVKKMEHAEEKKKDEERKVISIPVVQGEENLEKECAGNSAKKRAPSPKSSKLPPVCLRVDPPSKSKKVNGSSRSPSPPADGRRSRHSSNESSKSLNQNEESQNQVDKRNIKVVEGTTEGKRESQTNNHIPPSHEEVPLRKSRVDGVDVVVNQDVAEATESEKGRLEGQLVNKEETNKVRRKMLSDSEAATTIQSVYRGFEVRKSETLKKLRQIAEITQKTLELKARISAIDSCSDVEIDEKQLVAIGETIMGLLLKLDTIQGLHSCVRDMRKYVAKELVSLQEKLDSLTTRKAQAPIVPPSSETQEGPTAIVTDNVRVESNQSEAEVVLDSTQVSGIDTDAQSGPESFDKSQLMAADDSGDNMLELPADSNVGPQMPESDQQIELEDQKQQVLDIGEGQVTAEIKEESLESECAIETPVFHADDKADTPGEVAGSSSLVESFGKVGEVAGQNKLPQVVLETTEIAGDECSEDDPTVEDIKVVDAATENRGLNTSQLENVDGNQEKKKNVGQESKLGPEEMLGEEALDKDVSETKKNEEVVSDMEGGKFSPKEDQEVQTETELSTPVQEKEKAEDHKETDTTQELVPPVMEERVDDGEIKEVFDRTDIDGNDKKAHMLSDEHLEKGLPMPNDMVDQSEGPGKVNMEKGEDREAMEENKRLKEMMEKLIEAGNEQLATITKLSGKVKDLEKKLSKNKKLKTKKKPRGKRQDMVLV